MSKKKKREKRKVSKKNKSSKQKHGLDFFQKKIRGCIDLVSNEKIEKAKKEYNHIRDMYIKGSLSEKESEKILELLNNLHDFIRKGEKENLSKKKSEEKKEAKNKKKVLKEHKNIESKKVKKERKSLFKIFQEKKKEKIKNLPLALKKELGTYETDLDILYKLVESQGRVNISSLSKYFGVDKKLIEEWARILEEYELIDIHYPAIGDIELIKIKKENEKERKNN